MKNIFSRFGSLALVLLLGGSCLAEIPTKTAEVKGLESEVLVRRDARSIPYIKAGNLKDLYFGQGFETARDRLWQMDLMRRVARGRLAELFGKAVLEEDKRWRRFGFSEIAAESAKNLNPKLKLALESYARGVNAYISSVKSEDLPVEFQILKYEPEPWTAADTIVIGKILADALSTTWWLDFERVRQKKLPTEKFRAITNVTTPADVVLFGKDARLSKSRKAGVATLTDEMYAVIEREKEIRKSSLSKIGLYANNLAASNNWVISGKKTIDGNAILANDPHLRPSAPGIWYLTHLSAPNMRVAGVTFPGVPGIVLGHNENIAWGATNVGPDVQDVYLEEFNERNEYKTTKGWKKAKVRKEIIRYRLNPILPETNEEELEVLETSNGVVFRDYEGKKVSLKWTALDPDNQEFEAFIQLNDAKDWKGFRRALRGYGGATQNFVYADTKGNIGWQVAGKIPIRRKGDGSEPYKGDSSDGDWIGYISLDDLPSLYNPDNGFIVTANQRIAGTDYKYSQVTRQYAGPWRARRIFDLIKANPKISVNDVRDIQHDVFNIPLASFAREIVRRQAGSPEVLSELKGWDGKMTADSSGAVLANSINTCVGNEIARENPGVSGWRIRQFVLPFDIPSKRKLWIPSKYKGSWSAFLSKCSNKSYEKLMQREENGADPSKWRWGTANRANFLHPLARVPLIGARFKVDFTNVDGNGQVPNVGAAVSMRLIATPAAWDLTHHVIPLGQSGASDSPHWKDQFESWRTGKRALFPFTPNAVKAAAKTKTKLLPEGSVTRSGT
ncbi:MAG: penicillin acylase family protein [Pyrinomonadaceae bacterium]|nr:penicillin acylase family protein [Pyrinomonadaceae bacterium]